MGNGGKFGMIFTQRNRLGRVFLDGNLIEIRNPWYGRLFVGGSLFHHDDLRATIATPTATTLTTTTT